MMDSHVTTKDSKWPPRDAKQPQSRFWGETKGQKEVICHLNRQRQPQRDMEGTQRFKKTLKRMKMVRQRLKTAGDSKTSEKWHKMTTNQGNTKTKYEDNNEEIWKDNNETLKCHKSHKRNDQKRCKKQTELQADHKEMKKWGRSSQQENKSSMKRHKRTKKRLIESQNDKKHKRRPLC